ncbi:MAG: hypothetical protein [Olavius algarvensis Gamma 3 endosymbiont]|nr:MAG: hypothetical protein [Olavius algarvensis Gamma 3 endosymbiont]
MQTRSSSSNGSVKCSVTAKEKLNAYNKLNKQPAALPTIYFCTKKLGVKILASILRMPNSIVTRREPIRRQHGKLMLFHDFVEIASQEMCSIRRFRLKRL